MEWGDSGTLLETALVGWRMQKRWISYFFCFFFLFLFFVSFFLFLFFVSFFCFFGGSGSGLRKARNCSVERNSFGSKGHTESLHGRDT